MIPRRYRIALLFSVHSFIIRISIFFSFRRLANSFRGSSHHVARRCFNIILSTIMPDTTSEGRANTAVIRLGTTLVEQIKGWEEWRQPSCPCGSGSSTLAQIRPTLISFCFILLSFLNSLLASLESNDPNLTSFADSLTQLEQLVRENEAILEQEEKALAQIRTQVVPHLQQLRTELETQQTNAEQIVGRLQQEHESIQNEQHRQPLANKNMNANNSTGILSVKSVDPSPTRTDRSSKKKSSSSTKDNSSSSSSASSSSTKKGSHLSVDAIRMEHVTPEEFETIPKSVKLGGESAAFLHNSHKPNWYPNCISPQLSSLLSQIHAWSSPTDYSQYLYRCLVGVIEG